MTEGLELLVFVYSLLHLSFRLFFGMGIIWYFEVIAFFYGGEWSTVTDIINMLQVYGLVARLLLE